jgi:hypothetical protein
VPFVKNVLVFNEAEDEEVRLKLKNQILCVSLSATFAELAFALQVVGPVGCGTNGRAAPLRAGQDFLFES